MKLKYIPKRIHFSYNGTVLKLKLVIMNHNANLNKEQIGDKAQFSKATKTIIQAYKIEMLARIVPVQNAQ